MQKGLKACADNVFKLMKTTTKKKTNKKKHKKSTRPTNFDGIIRSAHSCVIIA